MCVSNVDVLKNSYPDLLGDRVEPQAPPLPSPSGAAADYNYLKTVLIAQAAFACYLGFGGPEYNLGLMSSMFHICFAAGDINRSYKNGSATCSSTLKSIIQIAGGAAMFAHTYSPSPVTAIPLGIFLLASGGAQLLNGIENIQEGFSSKNASASSGHLNERIKKVAKGMLSTTLGALSVCASTNFFSQAFYLKRNAVIITASSDHNGALKITQTKDAVARLYKAFKATVKNEDEICQVLKNARDVSGKPIDALMIHAHGDSLSMDLGDNVSLTKYNLDKVVSCINENLAAEAPIILQSCSTGGVVSHGLNFAQTLATYAKRAVQAPIHASQSAQCSIFMESAASGLRLRCFDSFFGNDYIRVFNPT